VDSRHLSEVIFEYAGRIGREQDRDALIGIIANMGRDLVGADRCTIWLVDQEKRQLVARFAHGSGVVPIGVDQGFVGRCVATGEVVMSNAAADDPRFSSFVDRQTGYRTQSVLTVPMRTANGTIMGAFQAVNKPGGFAPVDAELLALAAAYSAGTIETQTLLRNAEAARRVTRELEIARDVQQRLLAGSQVHRVEGIEFVATCRPAREVGGDYFDLLPLPTGQVALAVGDISGKGIGAALMMASVQASLHALVLQNNAEPAELVTRLNQWVVEASTGLYSTLFFALLDLKARTLTTVNGGHCYPLLLRKEGVQEIREGGPPIGLLPNASYAQQSHALVPGDSLVCFSDGLSEAQNPDGEFWEEHGFRETIVGSAGLPASAVVGRIMAAADVFGAGAAQHDDMTVVALRVTA
jgi:phosphoserine phosphatase RsbU/P